jgi:death-on-curing protein
MITLSQEQIIRLHGKMVEATGGLDGIRDETMLDSALSVIGFNFGTH